MEFDLLNNSEFSNHFGGKLIGVDYVF